MCSGGQQWWKGVGGDDLTCLDLTFSFPFHSVEAKWRSMVLPHAPSANARTAERVVPLCLTVDLLDSYLYGNCGD